MKKILLFAGLFMTLSVSAQIYSAMDSTAFATWTSYDLDGDGNGWIAGNINGMSAVSYSYDNASGALTPDNLFASPAIDLSGGSNLTLTYNVTAIDQAWVSEKYAIYVVTDLVALAAGNFPTPIVDETLPGTGVFTRSIDISAQAAGQSSVYIVIRHYQSTDWFAIGFDDLTITGDYAAVEENTLTTVSAYPNPATDVLNITTNEPVSTVKIMTMDGKVVVENNSVNDSFINLDVNDLEAGMYVYEVATADGKVSRDTFIKQ
ncbi:MAG: T9SS type A sorting domain-containing protein [Putridiphycobacter sp.]|nr:T9SS type A sorting domain-containing protein [Putridiphycobacter sp.]